MFSHLPLNAALEKLVDLEYTHVELMIHENGGHLKPSAVLADLDGAIETCRHTYRLTPIAYSVDIETSDESLYYQQFAACSKLAKSTKVVLLVVRAAELGTPFNAEVERLREMATIAGLDGCRVALLTEAGRMTQDPDTAVVLCDSVKGLCLALDPSHYICGPHKETTTIRSCKHVFHVRLRDTRRTSCRSVSVRARCKMASSSPSFPRSPIIGALVDITPPSPGQPGRQNGKMRLLLESLL